MTTELDPEAIYWAELSNISLRIPAAAVDDIHQSGPADEAVSYWAPKIRALAESDAPHPYWAPTPDKVRAELRECGAWSADELADDPENWLKLVWIAACSIGESDCPDCSPPARF